MWTHQKALSCFLASLVWLGISCSAAAQETPGANADAEELADLTADIEGDVLAYSQSELRQIVNQGYGLSVLGGSPWQSFGVFYLMPWRKSALSEWSLGYGSTTEQGRLDDGTRYDNDTRSVTAAYKMMYFISDFMPFYLGWDLGLAHWNSTLDPLGSALDATYKSKRSDLGIFAGGNFGILWVAQSKWLWGMNLFEAFYSLPLAKLSGEGADESQREIRAHLGKLTSHVSLSFQVAYFL